MKGGCFSRSAAYRCSVTRSPPPKLGYVGPGDDGGVEARRVLAPVAHQPAKGAVPGAVVGPAMQEIGPLLVVQRPGDDDLDQRVPAV
jgi:hypothetical protein